VGFGFGAVGFGLGLGVGFGAAFGVVCVLSAEDAETSCVACSACVMWHVAGLGSFGIGWGEWKWG
jgi:hypothetical protein